MTIPARSGDQASRAALDTIRTQRIRVFISILAVLNLPFIALGVVDAPNSPVTLIAAVTAELACGLYYLLLRRGYGVPATYGYLVLLAALIAVGVHNTGGVLTAISVLYILLLVGAGTVLNEPRALDVALLLCLLSYCLLAAVELTVAPPEVFRGPYLSLRPIPIISLQVAMLVALVGVWLVLRRNIVGLHRALATTEQARHEAELRADENAGLAAQVQASNSSLLASQARLKETIEALALPVIPLAEGAALLTLIGYLDQERAESVTTTALRAVQEQRLRAVIVDITGLSMVDGAVARRIEHLAHALQLLGARVLLTGIRPETAQTMVAQHLDLGQVETVGRLQEAIALVLAEVARPAASRVQPPHQLPR